MRYLPFLLLSALLIGCSTTRVGISYNAPVISQTFTNTRPLEIGSFIDQRGEPATWLGAIRGGYGNPLTNLESNISVSQLVQEAFSTALQARGVAILASAPEIQLSGIVKKLFCNQLIKREADVEIELQLTEISSKKVLFSRTYSATNYENAFFASGVFASIEDLRTLTERTLQEVIDKALNDSAISLALAR